MNRITITAGHPTDRELAAVVAALAAHARIVDTGDRPQRSAWMRAARLESCGHPPIDDPIRVRSY